MRKLSLLASALVVMGVAIPAHAQAPGVPQGDPTDLPVLSAQTEAGARGVREVSGPAPAAKVADGDISDWVGTPSRYGGSVLYSGGELIYQDHIFDAYGADDGRDAERLRNTDSAEEAAPTTYRIDALAQADAPGELGVDQVPEQYHYDDTYGDAVNHQDRSDLEELRVALSGSDLAVMARTTTMTGPKDTALLLLADTTPGEAAHDVPFNSGLHTTVADVAVFIADGVVRVADLATGSITTPAAAAVASPTGWTNALEATLPLSSVSASDGSLSLAAATGAPNSSGDGFAGLALESPREPTWANVANVAFRLTEPVRIWFEREQALALNAGSIDPFFLSLDAAEMQSGVSQEYVPGAGYHDRIFVSDESTGVPKEGGRDGIWQHYGVYLPTSYDGAPTPLQWWLHWRGGTAHSGAAVVPKIFTQLGEDKNTIVVAPSGRGTSTWYVGRGQVDFLEVWADVMKTFSIDRDHVYVTGHSMGGWGSYLLTLLYPDRFAAGAPVAGPVTQGAWTGADFSGCDEFQYDEYTPCYISANESRPRDQHTRKLLDNALHVPYAILQGTSDELVPYSGVLRQTEQLARLGYRYRFFTYPGYEHYSHPIADQWAEMGSYLHSFTRPENPAHVVYKRDMPFELATEEVQSGGADLNFDFDSAYWMSQLTPVDANKGVAAFDGRSMAISEQPHVAVPDTGPPTAPGQTGPYVITGLQWLDDPTKAPAPEANAFDASLSGASAVKLDLARMAIKPTHVVTGVVDTTDALDLRLDGGWATAPSALIDGQPVSATLTDGVLHVPVPVGKHDVTVTPPEPRENSSLSLERSGKGANVTLTARLSNAASGAPVAGATIHFSGNDADLGSATTNEDGIAAIKAPKGYWGKGVRFTATFDGDGHYESSSASTTA